MKGFVKSKTVCTLESTDTVVARFQLCYVCIMLYHTYTWTEVE